MWRITEEGRSLLKGLANNCGGRTQFGLQVGIGKNQIKPILDDANHTINHITRNRLRESFPIFEEGFHYHAVDSADACVVRLARDRDRSKSLTYYDRSGIERLYQAFLENPAFENHRDGYHTLPEFRDWLKVWGNASEDLPKEQIITYRVFEAKVIAFLFGERWFRTPRNPEIFVIWYLIGTTNAFYEGSPVGLGEEAARKLPVGERESAVRLVTCLLEELSNDKTASYMLFEVGATQLKTPHSMTRLLFQVYARAQDEVQALLANNAVLRNSQCYVLEFSYLAPLPADTLGSFELIEHRLGCCPLRPELAGAFRSGKLPAPLVENLLQGIYSMLSANYDVDSLERAGHDAMCDKALEIFRNSYVLPQIDVPCLPIKAYLAHLKEQQRVERARVAVFPDLPV